MTGGEAPTKEGQRTGPLVENGTETHIESVALDNKLLVKSDICRTSPVERTCLSATNTFVALGIQAKASLRNNCVGGAVIMPKVSDELLIVVYQSRKLRTP